MKKAIIYVSLIAILLITVLPARAAEHEILPSGLGYDKLAETIEDFAKEHLSETPGAAAAVFDKNGTLYKNWFGWADKENALPMSKDIVVEWGSVTKLIVWVSVMQLWEQGRIDLNADIQTYLPEGFLRNIRYQTPITVLDLMNHQAGFEETLFMAQTSLESNVLPLEEYLQKVQPEQVFQPGTITAYSNWGATLTGYIVERISGVPYWQYVQEHIFAPLGMEHTSINADLSDNLWVKEQRKLLRAYTSDGKPIPKMGYILMYPAGMCISTLDDFIIFGQALLNSDSPLFENSRTTEVLFTPTSYYGNTSSPRLFHGFFQDNSMYLDAVWHGGNTEGCSSALILNLEEGIGMAVMTNRALEEAFNEELPPLVFGKVESGLSGGPVPENYVFLESGRNIFFGPLKLVRLFSVFSLSSYLERAGQKMMAYSERDGIPRISVMSADIILRSVWDVLPLYVSAGFWLFSFLFCLILLFCILRRRFSQPLDKLSALICFLEILPVAALALVAISMIFWQWPMWIYRLWAMGNGALLLAVFGCATVFVWRIRTIVLSGKRKVVAVSLIVTAVITVWNICFWNLFQFWKIP